MIVSSSLRRHAWEVVPAVRPTWEALMRTDPYALPSQAPAWVDALCTTGPYRDASLELRSPEGRRLVLPMVRRTGVPAPAATRSSMPSRWANGGLVAEDGVHDAADARAVVALLAGSGPLVIVPNPRLDDRWRHAAPWSYATAKHGYELDTTGGFEDVWTHLFSSSVRRAVRKAERSDVVVERDTTGRLLPLFVPLYQESVRRWAEGSGMPAWLARRRAARDESLDKLQQVARGFGEACVTWMAFVEGRPAAAIIVLTHGPNVEYWRGAMSLPLAGPVRANALLHRLAIKEACARGAARYSFGISTPGTSLARFKEGFGATAVPYAGYVLEPIPVRRATRTGRRLARRSVVAVTSRAHAVR
ncbi:GNAT family N-acetyltransferase [Nocardioides sp. zg-579]|uniref:GNAT family N-acetyltransferase n=1 Tax=Nocardioides marmotae TaxID=2663857 RepID=A0A6I3JG06_9ACTN|nr:GNAT family N-acetyltransferase [Nocardioides marmotae]MCR6033345.1 GNAT family N-acetyltransferase [Gordonia jinghuaiqii]MTB97002.1 GNAT family N-acetyltransferase [Nocardioides marmotae]QKE00620.1 GNAT family N-acetyltransferase [Nocardioides marmotae]